ncbi:phosphorylase family protein [Amycolatopsis lexingtonensis]|uniref:phosphorylase family protein n=1 Tax=Amycolatopsis lexingtonensis TaxID=218822 RepID=UPI003F72A10E
MTDTVVICTALDVEYRAVREHVRGPFTEREERGALYDVGAFGPWTVALAQTGAGNTQAGVELERAISVFRPRVVLFVGVAGGRKDVSLGDVVVADHVYDYESGKDTTDGYLPRIKTAAASMPLVRRAQRLARDSAWQHRIRPAAPETVPRAVVKPIAAGGKVVAGTASATARFLERHCGDAAAVEMEAHGFLYGAYVNEGVQALVVRGISDLLSGKTGTADEHWQPVASRHAAAFAFELLTVLSARESEQADQAYAAARELHMSWDKKGEDLVEIERLYRLAADGGHADAMAMVGLIAEGRLRAAFLGQPSGDPSAADVQAALHWYAKSATHGSPFGAFHLGRVHEEYYGDPDEALKWYEKAAAGGHGAARASLEGLRRRLELGLGALAGHAPFERPPLKQEPSEGDPMTVDTDYERWVKAEFRSEPQAFAFCLGDLQEACGGQYGEWGTLTEEEVVAILGHFCRLMPARAHLPAVAFEYYDRIGEGNLRAFAARLRSPGAPAPEEFAPVWWWQRAENRVSTGENFYGFDLAVQDYDWATSLVGDLIEDLRADEAPDAGLRETILHLRLVARALAKRRELAIPAASGDGKMEFSLLLTPEQFAVLVRVAATASQAKDAEADFREFWQRVHQALEAAHVTPFE